MDTSVYLVSYMKNCWLKEQQKEMPVCLFICIVIVKRNKNKKNQADLVPACRVVFTLL